MSHSLSLQTPLPYLDPLMFITPHIHPSKTGLTMSIFLYTLFMKLYPYQLLCSGGFSTYGIISHVNH